MADKISLKSWINSEQKAKGLSTKEAQKSASKYSSISQAKKAGSLYYTDKSGKTQIAAYASDLSAPANGKTGGGVKKSLRPKLRPGITTPKVTTTKLSNTKGGRGDGVIEMATRALDKPPSSYTYNKWKTMSRAERKAAGLPVSVIGGELGFKRFRSGFTGKDYTITPGAKKKNSKTTTTKRGRRN
tara:strand:+ start:802 stop:1359 length:558 start_codon:yes stop_codon:yes gene_type:complete